MLSACYWKWAWAEFNGKTVITLSAIQSLMYDSYEVNKVLVIAPLRVAQTVSSRQRGTRTQFAGGRPCACVVRVDLEP